MTRRDAHPEPRRAGDRPGAGPAPADDLPPGVDVFLRLLGEQRGLYERVRDIGLRQAELIAAGDTQALLTVLQERQGLIESVGQLNRRLIPHREAWGRAVDAADDALRARVRGLIDQTQALISTILRQDESDRRALQHRLSGAGAALEQVARTRRAGQAYRRSDAAAGPTDPAGGALFTDQRG